MPGKTGALLPALLLCLTMLTGCEKTAVQPLQTGGEYSQTQALPSGEQETESAKISIGYELKCNGAPLTGDESLPPGAVEVSITQRRGADNLPDDEPAADTALSGAYFFEHLSFPARQPDGETLRDGTDIQAMEYHFDSCKAGDTIEVQLTDELRGRLGLSMSTIHITIG